MTTRICNTCREEWYIENFPTINNKPTNKCWNCTRQYNREYSRLIRERAKRKQWKWGATNG